MKPLRSNVRYIAINDNADTLNGVGNASAQKRIADLEKLDQEITREFIEKIVVHERNGPWKKKNCIQQIDVYFIFVGQV